MAYHGSDILFRLDCAGDCVAGVGKGRLARFLPSCIESLKFPPRQQYLASYLHSIREIISLESERDRPDRADRLRHILAILPIAAGECLVEQSLLVDHRDRDTVKLQLRYQLRGLANRFSEPPVEVFHLAYAVGIGKGEHRHSVGDSSAGSNPTDEFAPHSLRRRVGGDQLRMGFLKRLQLLHQEIEVPVADGGSGEDVVPILVLLQLVSQLLYPSAGFIEGHYFRRKVEETVILAVLSMSEVLSVPPQE